MICQFLDALVDGRLFAKKGEKIKTFNDLFTKKLKKTTLNKI